ncbi:MAG TPA: alpha/beta hydrolase, partial [Burkholderiales bacterium]|nr:alpha/beta hydrolase [Burkholderiales bacterium]
TRHAATMDLRYGLAERNRIDLFPAGPAAAPLLVFIHGGYWQMRAKEVFAFVAAGPLAHGISVALAGYTLAPQIRLDGIVAEIRSCLDYLSKEHSHIVLSGWSAGGHLTAMCMSHPAVKAGLAISGIYDLEPMRLSYINDKLRLDEAEQKRNSPIFLSNKKKLTVAYGGAELPELQRQSEDYAQAAKAKILPLAGRDHFTILEELASPQGALTTALRTLIE